MGGVPKGLLTAPDGESIASRLRSLLADLALECMLVGDADSRAPYAHLGLPGFDDAREAKGPLAGVIAALRETCASGATCTLIVACDMPFVSAALLERLIRHPTPEAAIVAPRRAGRWEPLCARYDAARVLPVAMRRARSGSWSMQSLLDETGAIELPLAISELAELDDWDSPADLTRAHRTGGHL